MLAFLAAMASIVFVHGDVRAQVCASDAAMIGAPEPQSAAMPTQRAVASVGAGPAVIAADDATGAPSTYETAPIVPVLAGVDRARE